MTIVGALIATKLTNNSTIENFKDTMVLDNNKEVSQIEYNAMITNSSVNFILICVIILVNIIPALLIAYHCSKTLTEKILTMTIALFFSDFYIFYFALRKYFYQDKKFCGV